MKNLSHVFFATFLLLQLAGCATPETPRPELRKYVNAFIGTLQMGNTYPGAQAPFGMISISPNTVFENYAALNSYDSRPGYSYSHDRISGFSLSRFNGIGCHAMQDWPLTLTTHELDSSPVRAKHQYAHRFQKADEQALPGFYQVRFAEDSFTVKATASVRSGIVEVENASGKPIHLLINPNGAANGITHARLRYDPVRRLFLGTATSGGFCDRDPSQHPYTVYLALMTDREPIGHGMWSEAEKQAGQAQSEGMIAAYLTFAPADTPLRLKMALSYVSEENALLNLTQELPDWAFERVLANVVQEWEQALGKVQIEDPGKEEEKTVFYTALYRNMLQPSIFQDVNGQYIGFDDQVHQAPEGRNVYTNFSLWDTYRTSAQLQSLLFPDRVSDMVQSMLLFTQQSHGGLPVWSLNNVDNGVMNGYSAYPFIANAYAFGARKFDLGLAVRLMKRAAEEELPIKNGRGWEQLALYKKYGYLPADSVERYSVSKTIEYSVDDFALARLCAAFGDQEGYARYLARSKNVFNLLCPETGYFRPRNADGSWYEPFALTSTFGFNEGNAAQYGFGVPHHWEEFVQRSGGPQAVEQRLDSLFSKILTHGWHIRQPYYWLGNEPVFGANYSYNLLGKPERNDAISQEIMSHFTNKPDGLAGNDDAGAMSALFVFTALGRYPLITGTDTLIRSKPLFEKVRTDNDWLNQQLADNPKK